MKHRKVPDAELMIINTNVNSAVSSNGDVIINPIQTLFAAEDRWFCASTVKFRTLN